MTVTTAEADLLEEGRAALRALVGSPDAGLPRRPVERRPRARRGPAAGCWSSSAPAGASRRSTSSPPPCCRARGRGPDADRVAAARAHARPGRRRRAGRRPRRDDELRQRRRVGRRRAARSPPTRSTCCSSAPSGSNNPRFRDRAAAAAWPRRCGLARRRRGALHQRLGPRLPARLPADPRPARHAAAGHAGARHHRDRERAGRRRRRRAARRRRHERASPCCAARWPAPRCGSACCALPRPPSAARPGWSRTWATCRAAASSTRSPSRPREDAAALLARGRARRCAPTPAAPTRPSARLRRTRCATTRSRRWSRPAPSAWASTSPTSASSCTSARPSSPVAYYQQVGRAGRATERADVLLLPGPEDRDIWRYFATASMPRQEQADAVLAALGASPAEPLSTAALETVVDVRRTRLELLLKVLDVDGAVAARPAAAGRPPARPWTYDAERYARVAAARDAEAAAMLDYERHDRAAGCAFLQRRSTTRRAADCGRCDRCAGPWYPTDVPDGAAAGGDASGCAGSASTIEPRAQWPTGMDRLGVPVQGRIAADEQVGDGPGGRPAHRPRLGQRLRELLAPAPPDAPADDRAAGRLRRRARRLGLGAAAGRRSSPCRRRAPAAARRLASARTWPRIGRLAVPRAARAAPTAGRPASPAATARSGWPASGTRFDASTPEQRRRSPGSTAPGAARRRPRRLAAGRSPSPAAPCAWPAPTTCCRSPLAVPA